MILEAFKTAGTYFKNVFNAQNMLAGIANTGFDATKIDDYVRSLNGLNKAQQLAAINSSKLKESEKQLLRERILNTQATNANSEANMANAASDKVDTATNEENIASTVSDSAATAENTQRTMENTAANLENSASDVTGTATNTAAGASVGLGAKLSGAWAAIPLLGKVGIIIAAVAAIAGIITGIVNAVKGVKEDELEEIKKKGTEAKEAIDKLKSSFRETKQTTEDLSKRFAELSQGVDDFTGKNVSLSTEEYEEFLDMSNQLAELFPSLSRTYDENGNAIVKLSGDVDTVVGSLQKLIDTERELANQEIAKNLPDSYKESKRRVDEYNHDLEKEKAKLNALEQLMIISDQEEIDELLQYQGLVTTTRDLEEVDKVWEKYNQYKEVFEELGEMATVDYTQAPIVLDDGTSGLETTIYFSLDSNSLDLSHANMNKIKSDISQLEGKIKNEWSSLSNDLMSGIQTDGQYKMLNDSAQVYVQNAIGNLDYDALTKEFGGDEEGFKKLQQYIQDNILGLFNNSEVQTLTSDLFKLDFSKIPAEEIKSSIMEYVNKIVKIAEELDIEGVDSDFLLKIFGLEDTATITDNYNKIKDSIARSIVGVEENESMHEGQKQQYDVLIYKIDQFAEEYSINTQDELAAFNDAWEKANGDIDKAFMLYIKYLNEKNRENSFLEVFNAKDFKEQREELLKLAKAGELTTETLESTEEYQKLLDKTGLSAESCKDKIYNLLINQEKLAAAHTGLDNLKSLYEEFSDLGFVTAKSLESLPDEFKKLKGYNLFSRIAGDPKNDIDKIQQAFNDIVKEYLIFTQTLNSEGLLSDDLEVQQRAMRVYAANLREMGITNAEKVVQQTIKSMTASEDLFDKAEEEYSNYLESKNQADLEFIESSTSYNSQLINSMGTAYETDYNNWVDALAAKQNAYELFALEVEKINNSWSKNGTNTINYENIKERIKKGEYFNEGELFAMGLDSATMQRFMTMQSEYRSVASEAEKLKNDLQANYTFKEVDLSLKFDGSDTSGGLSSGSDKTFDWIEIKLENLNEELDKTKETAEDTFSGWKVRTDSYKKAENQIKHLINVQTAAKAKYMEEANKSGLSEEYKRLVEQGAIDITKLSDSAADQKLKEQIEYYKEWYDKAKACDDAIIQLEKDFKEMYRDSRTFRWETFDTLVEQISRITEETEYFIGLLSEEDLFDDNGNMTKYADTTLGLHLSNIETYKQLAKDNLEEINTLQKEVISGGADQETIDRYNTLIEAHRDNINAIKDEEQAILDLVEEGYQKQLDALNELIDKKKESLNAEKDLYSYQKSIQEKSDKVASLKKQAEVYEKDDSEEGIAKYQQISVALKEAEEDLEQTEYEKMVSDTEAMLDQLSADYEEWMTARLDDENRLLEEIRDKISGEGDSILSTLQDIATENDTVLSKDIETSIVEGATTAIDKIANAVVNALGGNEEHKGNAGTHKAYASGTKRSGKEWAWTQEKGVELIRTKDGALLTPLDNSMVFNNESSRRLWEFSQNPVDYLARLGMQNIIPQIDIVTPRMPELARNTSSPVINLGGINIVCNEVNNADDIVNDLISNKKFEKAMFSAVGNAMTGGNSLNKFRY